MDWLRQIELNYLGQLVQQADVAAEDARFRAAVLDGMIKVVEHSDVEVKVSFDNDGELALAMRIVMRAFKDLHIGHMQIFDPLTKVGTFELSNGSGLVLKRKSLEEN